MANDTNFIQNWLEDSKKTNELEINLLKIIEHNLTGVNNLELDEGNLLKQLIDVSNEGAENA